jgi:hypothetical protein
VDAESLREAVGLDEAKAGEMHFMMGVCERRAEIVIVRRQMEVRLMHHSLRLLKLEHSSLLALFEQAGTSRELQLYIHPQQQFAQTLTGTDQSPHLDITHKLACVQQFITRLRNRCTEVETLTSGVGVVFSVSIDNDECCYS